MKTAELERKIRAIENSPEGIDNPEYWSLTKKLEELERAEKSEILTPSKAAEILIEGCKISELPNEKLKYYRYREGATAGFERGEVEALMQEYNLRFPEEFIYDINGEKIKNPNYPAKK